MNTWTILNFNGNIDTTSLSRAELVKNDTCEVGTRGEVLTMPNGTNYYLRDNYERYDLIQLIREGCDCSSHVFDRYREDLDFIFDVMINYNHLLKDSGLGLITNKHFIIETIKKYGSAGILALVKKEYLNDKRFMIDLIKADKYCLFYSSREIKELCRNKDFLVTLEEYVRNEDAEHQKNAICKIVGNSSTKKVSKIWE